MLLFHLQAPNNHIAFILSLTFSICSCLTSYGSSVSTRPFTIPQTNYINIGTKSGGFSVVSNTFLQKLKAAAGYGNNYGPALYNTGLNLNHAGIYGQKTVVGGYPHLGSQYGYPAQFANQVSYGGLMGSGIGGYALGGHGLYGQQVLSGQQAVYAQRGLYGANTGYAQQSIYASAPRYSQAVRSPYGGGIPYSNTIRATAGTGHYPGTNLQRQTSFTNYGK